jgi:hypothetical protein
MRPLLLRSPVAQLAEHPAVNRRVVGSSPTRGASNVLQTPRNRKGVSMDARFLYRSRPPSSRRRTMQAPLDIVVVFPHLFQSGERIVKRSNR